MTIRRAIRILIESPCYWLARPAQRYEIVRHFMAQFAAAGKARK